MSSMSLIQAIRVRLTEINPEISKLEVEREHLTALLRTYDAPEPVSTSTIADNVTPIRPKFSERNPASRTRRLAGFVVNMLRRMPGKRGRFVDFYADLPLELVGTGKYAKETTRTFLRRVAADFGLDYQDGWFILNENDKTTSAGSA